jgi:hypothetical protein
MLWFICIWINEHLTVKASSCLALGIGNMGWWNVREIFRTNNLFNIFTDAKVAFTSKSKYMYINIVTSNVKSCKYILAITDCHVTFNKLPATLSFNFWSSSILEIKLVGFGNTKLRHEVFRSDIKTWEVTRRF